MHGSKSGLRATEVIRYPKEREAGNSYYLSRRDSDDIGNVQVLWDVIVREEVSPGIFEYNTQQRFIFGPNAILLIIARY